MFDAIQKLRAKQLELAVDIIFTGWQTSIIRKLLAGEQLTDAERQEFSRKIRKKLKAIQLLHDLDVLLLPRSPGQLEKL